MPLDTPPCFVGGQGVIILRKADDLPLRARVYPVSRQKTSFSFNYPDGKATTLIRYQKWNDPTKLAVMDKTLNSEIPFKIDTAGVSISFDIVPDRDYDIIEKQGLDRE